MNFEDQVLLAFTRIMQDKTKHLRDPQGAPPPTTAAQPQRQTRQSSARPTSLPESGDLEYDDQQYRSLTNRQRAEIARGWFLLSRTEKFGLKPVTPYPVPLDATPKQREIWQRIDKAHARLILAHIYARKISPTRKWTHPEVIDLYFRRCYPWQYEQSTPSSARADQYKKAFDESEHPRASAGNEDGGEFIRANQAEATDTNGNRTLPPAETRREDVLAIPAQPARSDKPLNIKRPDGIDHILARPADEEKKTADIGPPHSWESWHNSRKQLDISDSADSVRVRKAIASTNTTFNLKDIPTLDPGMPATPMVLIRPDNSTTVGYDLQFGQTGSSNIRQITPAELARLNIRANLQIIKQGIVDAIDVLLRKAPPLQQVQGIPVSMATVDQLKPLPMQLSAADRSRVANKVADWYIKAVDEFLQQHPGARPALGWRFPRQSSKQAPWCGDWAEYMMKATESLNKDPDISRTLQFYPAQWNVAKLPVTGQGGFVGGRQHNWLAAYPKGYNGTDSPLGKSIHSFTQKDLVGKPVIYFDPWRDLLPGVYLPQSTGTMQTDWGYDNVTN